MRNHNFKYSALRYLDQWLSRDKYFCSEFRAAARPTRLIALRRAAAFYGVSRNLPKEFDSAERLGPLLSILDSVNRDDFEGGRESTAVLEARRRIAERYGDRGVLSLTTKMLWLKFRTPLVIYDSQARNALGTKAGDLEGYVHIWRKTFEAKHPEISDACESLVTVRDYCLDPGVATAGYIKELAEQRWFQERVLDNYLWNRGRVSDSR